MALGCVAIQQLFITAVKFTGAMNGPLDVDGDFTGVTSALRGLSIGASKVLASARLNAGPIVFEKFAGLLGFPQIA